MKYFIQSFFIIVLLIIFKLIGLKYSRIFSGNIFKIFGPKFRSQKISLNNISKAFPNLSLTEQNKILEKMWFNYGMILAEYVFINK